jgi:anti-sigma B factor antagonist
VAVEEHLHVSVHARADAAVVALNGELDLASAPLLEVEMDRAEVTGATKVVLDLRELRFIDSTGLHTIFSSHSSARERGQEFAITRGSEQVQRLLAITRMGEHLRIVDAPEEILTSGT